MTLASEDREKMLKAHSIGPRMADLKGADAHEIAFRINVLLGRKHINGQGVRALQNLIDLQRPLRVFSDAQRSL